MSEQPAVGTWASPGDPQIVPEHVYKWPDGKRMLLCEDCAAKMAATLMCQLKLTRDVIRARCCYTGWEHA